MVSAWQGRSGFYARDSNPFFGRGFDEDSAEPPRSSTSSKVSGANIPKRSPAEPLRSPIRQEAAVCGLLNNSLNIFRNSGFYHGAQRSAPKEGA